jgi:hypothetical protein
VGANLLKIIGNSRFLSLRATGHVAGYPFEHEKPEARWHATRSRFVAGWRLTERLKIWLHPFEKQRQRSASAGRQLFFG